MITGVVVATVTSVEILDDVIGQGWSCRVLEIWVKSSETPDEYRLETPGPGIVHDINSPEEVSPHLLMGWI